MVWYYHNTFVFDEFKFWLSSRLFFFLFSYLFLFWFVFRIGHMVGMVEERILFRVLVSQLFGKSFEILQIEWDGERRWRRLWALKSGSEWVNMSALLESLGLRFVSLEILGIKKKKKKSKKDWINNEHGMWGSKVIFFLLLMTNAVAKGFEKENKNVYGFIDRHSTSKTRSR